MEADSAVVLTDRQRDVLRLLAQGRSRQEIALELGISPLTVKAHIDLLRRRFNVTSWRRLIPIAHERGLV